MATKQKTGFTSLRCRDLQIPRTERNAHFFSFQHSQQFSENNLTAASSIKLLADDWIGEEIFLTFFFFLIFVEYSDHGSFSGGGGGVGDDRHWGPVATVPAVLDGQGDAGQRDAHENDDENATYPPSELTFFNLQNALFRLINEIRKRNEISSIAMPA